MYGEGVPGRGSGFPADLFRNPPLYLCICNPCDAVVKWCSPTPIAPPDQCSLGDHSAAEGLWYCHQPVHRDSGIMAHNAQIWPS